MRILLSTRHRIESIPRCDCAIISAVSGEHRNEKSSYEVARHIARRTQRHNYNGNFHMPTTNPLVCVQPNTLCCWPLCLIASLARGTHGNNLSTYKRKQRRAFFGMLIERQPPADPDINHRPVEKPTLRVGERKFNLQYTR